MPVMKLQTESIVDGRDLAGPRSIVSINPATEEEIATVSALDSGGAREVVAAAKAAYPAWSHTPVGERQQILRDARLECDAACLACATRSYVRVGCFETY